MEDQENVEWNIQPAEGTSTDPILAPSKPGVDVTKNVNLMPDQAANKAPAPITISDIFEADSLTSQASSVDEKDSNSAAREEKSMLTEIASQPSPLKTVASTKTKTATPTLANPKPSSPRAPAPKNKIKSEEKPEPTAPIKTLTPAKTKPATEKHSASKPSTPKPTTPTVVELPRVAKLSSPGRYSATVRYTPRSATKPKPKSGASKPVSASARPISRSKSRTSKTRGMVRPTQQIAKVLSPPEQCESCVSLGNQVENLKQDVEEYKKKYDEIQAMGENLYASYDQKCSIIRELEVGIEQRDQGIEILTTERDQAVESYERTYRVFEKVGEKLKLLEEEKKGILEQNAQLAASVAAGANVRTQLEELQDKLQNAEDALAASQEIDTSVLAASTEKELEISSLRESLGEKDKELSELREKLVAKESKSKATNALVTRAKRLAAAVNGDEEDKNSEQVENLLISNEVLREENKENNLKIEKLKKKYSQLEALLAAEKLKTKGLTMATIQQGDKIMAQEAKIEESKNLVAKAIAEKESAKSSAADAMKNKQRWSEERKRLSQDVQKLQEQLKVANKVALEEKQEKDDMLKRVQPLMDIKKVDDGRMQSAEEKIKELTSLLNSKESINRDLQSDLRLLYKKNKKDLQDLEAKYQHEAYKQKYEAAAQEANHLRTIVLSSEEASKELSQTAELQTKVAKQLAACKNLLIRRTEELENKSKGYAQMKLEIQQLKESVTRAEMTGVVRACAIKARFLSQLKTKDADIEKKMKHAILSMDKKLKDNIRTMQELQRELAEQRTESEFLQEEHKCNMAMLEEELQTARQAFAEKDTSQKLLVTSLQSLGEEKKTLEEKIKTLTEDLSQGSKTVETLQADLLSSKAELNEYQRSQRDYKSQKETQISTLQSQLKQEHEEVGVLGIQVTRLRQEKKDMDEKRALLLRGFEQQLAHVESASKAKLAQAISEKRELLERLEHGRSKRAELKLRLDTLKRESKQLDEQKRQMTAMQKEIESLRTKVKNAKKGAAQSDSAQQVMLEEIAQLKDQIHKSEQGSRDSDFRINSLEGEKSALNMEVSHVKAQLERMSSRAIKAEFEEGVAKRKLEELDESHRKLQQQLNEQMKILIAKNLELQQHEAEDKTKMQNAKRVEELEAQLAAAMQDLKERASQRVEELDAQLIAVKEEAKKREAVYEEVRVDHERMKKNGHQLMEIAKLRHKECLKAIQYLNYLYKAMEKKGQEFLGDERIQTVMKKAQVFMVKWQNKSRTPRSVPKSTRSGRN